MEAPVLRRAIGPRGFVSGPAGARAIGTKARREAPPEALAGRQAENTRAASKTGPSTHTRFMAGPASVMTSSVQP